MQRVLEAAKRAYANKTKDSITSQKLGSLDFWQIANIVLNKGKSAIPPLFNSPEVFLIKQNCLLKTFLGTLILMTQVSLYLFSPSRTNLKLLNISVALKMVKKVIMDLHLSKASGPNCIPLVVLKNCEPELSYILAELFNKCLRSLVFQIVGRFHQWSLCLRIMGKGLQLLLLFS